MSQIETVYDVLAEEFAWCVSDDGFVPEFLVDVSKKIIEALDTESYAKGDK